MIKVNLLTESRADYGIYYPLIKALIKDKRLELKILVTGMHLEEQHGITAGDIMAEFGGKCVCRYGNIQSQISPDWLIVLGDRRPMLEVTIEAAYRNIPVAHIQGGG